MKKWGIIALCTCLVVSATACSQRINTSLESSVSISSDSEPTSRIISISETESTPIQNLSSEDFSEIVGTPDIIICYVNGTEKTIESKQQINEILGLAQTALSEVVGQYGLAYEASDISNAKETGIVLEFLYDNPISAEWKYKPDFFVKYEYSLVTIVIDGGSSSLSKMVIVGSGTPTPIGDFTASNELLQFIDNL